LGAGEEGPAGADRYPDRRVGTQSALHGQGAVERRNARSAVNHSAAALGVQDRLQDRRSVRRPA
jgi:hypothetical protein